ncbi:MAG: ATP synthase F1 subunit epsilon [Coriobacteriia bacterium]|jgi:F-type H+-transporting ATPase subunit epsilon|nr:ATP synthase F1 subunit epsilon [Coriobacteriia bacterium]
MANPQLPARASGKIRLEVVTPEGPALTELVDEFTSPSVLGQFGVLPGHLPLLAALRTGIISYRSGNHSVSCAVGPGFVEVSDDHAILLTDRFSDKDSIDVVDTRMRLKETNAKLEKWDGEPGSAEHQALIGEEQWLAALLELYGDPPPPTMRPTQVPVPSGAQPPAPPDES